MYRLLVILFAFVYLSYYATLFADVAGLIRITNRKITVLRFIVPFYYWFAPFNEKKNRKVKIILGDK